MIQKLYYDNTNSRDVNHVADLLANEGVVIIPSDSLYAFACSMQCRRAVEKIAQLKGFTIKKAKYSMLCSSLSQASEYIRPVDKDIYQVLRSALPGPFTFILNANNQVPRNYQNPNKTIGIRIPNDSICKSIIDALGCPLIATSVRLENENQEKEYITDPELIHELFGDRVDLVIDAGIGEDIPSTVVDCSGGDVEIIRQGKGIL